MIKNTKASVNIILSELSFFAFLANLISPLFTIGYLTFSLMAGRGILAVNIALVSIAALNLAVFLITKNTENKSTKKMRRRVKHFCTLSKIVLNAIPLASVLYILAFTGEEISKIELALLPLMLLMWLVQLTLELVTLYVQNRLTLFTDAIKLDIEETVKPLTKVKNAFLGAPEKDDEEGVSDHNRRVLAKRIAADELERKERRLAEKEKKKKKKANSNENVPLSDEELFPDIDQGDKPEKELVSTGLGGLAGKIKDIFKK